MEIRSTIEKLIDKDTPTRLSVLNQLWANKDFWFFEATWRGLDPNGLRLEKCVKLDDDAPHELTFPEFQILHQNLSREYDHELLLTHVEKSAQWEWNEFYRRILMQDLNWVSDEEFRVALTRIQTTDKRAGNFLIPEYKLPTGKKITKAKMYGDVYCEPVMLGERLTLHISDRVKAINAIGKPIPFEGTLPPLEVPYVLDCTQVGDRYLISDMVFESEFQGQPLTPTDERIEALLAHYGSIIDADNRFSLIEKRYFSFPDQRDKFIDYMDELKRNKTRQVLAKSISSKYIRDLHFEWFIINV